MKIVQVYDYDWGLRDDFMGEASLPLGQLVPEKRNDLVLTLAETGEKEKRQKDKTTVRPTKAERPHPHTRRIRNTYSRS